MLISVRSVECGVRSRPTDVGARVLNLSFRTPHSALRICLLLAACTPITTRPDFRPDPRALTVVLDARSERVTTVLDSLVAAESLEVARANVRDGYVETAWYDPQAHRPRHHAREITNLPATATTARGRRSRITRRASCPRVATNTGTS